MSVQVESMSAIVLRENLVRFEGLPLTIRVASLPALDAGTRVRLELRSVDLLERSAACVYRESLGQTAVTQDAADQA